MTRNPTCGSGSPWGPTPPTCRRDSAATPRPTSRHSSALRALPVPDLVLPGHPRADPTPQEPRLSRQRWEAILDQGIAEMATLVARHEADGADFLDGEAKQLLPDLYYLGDFQGRAVYGFFASSRVLPGRRPGRARLASLPREPPRAASAEEGREAGRRLAHFVRCRQRRPGSETSFKDATRR